MEYTDHITLETISPERLVSVSSGDDIQHFDIETLYRFYSDNNLDKPMNPFTRQALPEDISTRVIDYGNSTKAMIYYNSKVFYVESHKTIGHLICTVLSQQDKLDVNTNLRCHIGSLYSKDLEIDKVEPFMSIFFEPFEDNDSRLSAMTKLCEYTKDRLWDKGMNNYGIYNQALQIKTRKIYFVLALPTRFIFAEMPYPIGHNTLRYDPIGHNTLRYDPIGHNTLRYDPIGRIMQNSHNPITVDVVDDMPELVDTRDDYLINIINTIYRQDQLVELIRNNNSTIGGMTNNLSGNDMDDVD